MTQQYDDMLVRTHGTDYQTAIKKARDESVETGTDRYVIRQNYVWDDTKPPEFRFYVVDWAYLSRQPNLAGPIVAVFSGISRKNWFENVTYTRCHEIDDIEVEYKGGMEWPDGQKRSY